MSGNLLYPAISKAKHLFQGGTTLLFPPIPLTSPALFSADTCPDLSAGHVVAILTIRPCQWLYLKKYGKNALIATFKYR
jgi:hypothetical protein